MMRGSGGGDRRDQGGCGQPTPTVLPISLGSYPLMSVLPKGGGRIATLAFVAAAHFVPSLIPVLHVCSCDLATVGSRDGCRSVL